MEDDETSVVEDDETSVVEDDETSVVEDDEDANEVVVPTVDIVVNIGMVDGAPFAKLAVNIAFPVNDIVDSSKAFELSVPPLTVHPVNV